MTFAELTTELLGLACGQSTLLIGIDGAGGSGKTTFAESLQESLAKLSLKVMTLSMDDFYRPSPVQDSGIDDQFLDGKIAWREIHDQVLVPLSQDRSGNYQRYDWTSKSLAEWQEVPVGDAVIVEGTRALQGPLARLYDFRIWLDCARSIRLKRGIERDGESARERWERIWMPAEDRYLAEQDPRGKADLIVDAAGELDIDLGQDFVARRRT